MTALSRWIVILVILLAASSRSQAAPLAPDTGSTERVSVASDGSQSNNESNSTSISADGRFVVFSSQATNLTSGDANGTWDIFLFDRLNRTTELISVSSDETHSNGPSYRPKITPDGRFVTFESESTNLVAGDTNGVRDIFLRDRLNGTTERASIADDETQANNSCWGHSISADGRFVAFDSYASNLVPGDSNAERDIFVRDRMNGTTELVSLDSVEIQGDGESVYPSISADGRYVAFESSASNLVPDDTNANADIFVRDRQNGSTEIASVRSDGTWGNGSSYATIISADGRWVVFISDATNLVLGDVNGYSDIFLHDRQTGSTERVSVAGGNVEANDKSGLATIARDGRFVVFESRASNLVTGDTNGAQDIFIRDRINGTTERVSVAGDESQAISASSSPSISTDLRFVVFYSYASNLVPGDTNGTWDIFVRDRQRNGFSVYLPLVRH